MKLNTYDDVFLWMNRNCYHLLGIGVCMQINVKLIVYLGVRGQYLGELPSLLAHPSQIEPRAILSIEIRNRTPTNIQKFFFIKSRTGRIYFRDKMFVPNVGQLKFRFIQRSHADPAAKYLMCEKKLVLLVIKIYGYMFRVNL